MPDRSADRPPVSGPPWRAPAPPDRSHIGAPSIVLDTVFRTLYQTVVLIGLYLHLAGHNQPGGGFIAGLVVGAALVLRFITAHPEYGTPLPFPSYLMMGVGLSLSAGMAVTSLILGNTLLEHHTWEFTLPVFGDVKVTSAIVFDSGILLIVVGVIAMLLEILGNEADPADRSAQHVAAGPGKQLDGRRDDHPDRDHDHGRDGAAGS